MGYSCPQFRYKVLIINYFLKTQHYFPHLGNFIEIDPENHKIHKS